MTTKDEILALAEKCGMATAPCGNGYWDNAAQMEAFYHAARKPLEEEIERLKTVPMKYRRMEFNAQLQKENDELCQQLAEKDAEIERQKGEQNDQLDTDSDDARTIQHRELDGAVEVGQLLGDSQNKETGNPKTQGTLSLADTFRGDDAALLRSVVALIELDLDGALVPHGIGGHARSLLSDLSVRLNERNRQLAAAQLQIKQYREALGSFLVASSDEEVQKEHERSSLRRATDLIVQPADTSALEAMIAKAGEVMRERAAKEAYEFWVMRKDQKYTNDAIRALPGVTLKDIIS